MWSSPVSATASMVKLHGPQDFLRRRRRARLPGAGSPNIDRIEVLEGAARCGAPSCTICAIVVVNRRVSSESTNARTKKIEAGERDAALEAKGAREAEKVAAAGALARELAGKGCRRGGSRSQAPNRPCRRP